MIGDTHGGHNLPGPAVCHPDTMICAPTIYDDTHPGSQSVQYNRRHLHK